MTGTPPTAPAGNAFDAMLPPEMALACEAAGVAKAECDALALIVLGVLAGAFTCVGL